MPAQVLLRARQEFATEKDAILLRRRERLNRSAVINAARVLSGSVLHRNRMPEMARNDHTFIVIPANSIVAGSPVWCDIVIGKPIRQRQRGALQNDLQQSGLPPLLHLQAAASSA